MRLQYKNKNFFGSSLNTIFGEIKISKDGSVDIDDAIASKILASYSDDFEEDLTLPSKQPEKTILLKNEDENDLSLLTREELIDFCVESGIEKSKVEKIKDKTAIIKILQVKLASK